MRGSEHQIETPPQGRITSDVSESRAVAQTGSAFPWGGRGRKFKSCQPDQFPCLSRNIIDVGLARFEPTKGQIFRLRAERSILSARPIAHIRCAWCSFHYEALPPHSLALDAMKPHQVNLSRALESMFRSALHNP
jgi:hypothetical protein